MFNKDCLSNYYSKEVCDTLNHQWSDEKIKVILDLITFLMKHNDNPSNVKSLENIMDNIDINTQTLISSLF